MSWHEQLACRASCWPCQLVLCTWIKNDLAVGSSCLGGVIWSVACRAHIPALAWLELYPTCSGVIRPRLLPLTCLHWATVEAFMERALMAIGNSCHVSMSAHTACLAPATVGGLSVVASDMLHSRPLPSGPLLLGGLFALVC